MTSYRGNRTHPTTAGTHSATEVYTQIVFVYTHTSVEHTNHVATYLVGQGDFKQFQSVLVPFLYHPAQVLVLLPGHAPGHGAVATHALELLGKA